MADNIGVHLEAGRLRLPKACVCLATVMFLSLAGGHGITLASFSLSRLPLPADLPWSSILTMAFHLVQQSHFHQTT